MSGAAHDATSGPDPERPGHPLRVDQLAGDALGSDVGAHADRSGSEFHRLTAADRSSLDPDRRQLRQQRADW